METTDKLNILGKTNEFITAKIVKKHHNQNE